MSFEPKKAVQKLPRKPGVYQFFDEEGIVIYVGKAKNLRNRVSSYFKSDRSYESSKTRVLAGKIRDIKFTLVDTEIDAWLLENNLIKKFKPRYNVLLKDDKTYPSLVIRNEPFPRIFGTRNIIPDGSKYFGPYASVTMMRTMMDMIKSLYPLRTCNLPLTRENIEAGKFKICLEYQIGNCKGPCEGLQAEEDYAQNIEEIREILRGNTGGVLNKLRERIKEASASLDFEQAHRLKEKLDILQNYQSKSAVVSAVIHNVDVFSIASDEKYAFVNYLKVARGMVVQTQTIELKKKLGESDAELLSLAIGEFRNRFESDAREIVVPFELEVEDPSVKFTVPRAGDKKKLLELSVKNVLFFRKSRLEQYEKLNPGVKTERILSQMKTDLRLTALPRHIECFDNSNFQGKYPVSAMVVFREAKPAKKDYRHFNIKTVEGPDDFASMKEVVHRRYRRLLEEGSSLPDLVVIDGGKGQLSAAQSALKLLGIQKEIPIIGIAKRLEEIYYPGDSLPLYIDKRSETLKVLQQMRDEAHRFGITFHRKKRDKGTLKTELEMISGIGPRATEKLLRHFRSVKKIKEASLEELKEVVPAKQAAKLIDWIREGGN
ncbi:excinuclease ABC subunit C [Anseongella ginsenosidimutans]|uniref:UvrABC system protein C n=1 Tax=Anseongella ginsenosidimutans TaxID=496056 RepID=A0A4R3L172_9SPHI|nr:excinuclease ABC subunit UvrC [Anseongella ginsenosidimutans]TCS90152.1 excinuclease ABC subunit C [Anseongella ginsenosidimutans]